MDLVLVPLHKYPEYLQKCCDLINSEWKRSNTARLRSLEASSDKLPTSLILLKGDILLGHVKLSPLPSVPNSCFVESVVIDNSERGKGYGSLLMAKTEDYCRKTMNISVIYLSTKGQEGFYCKLGYIECMPVSLYGEFKGIRQNDFSISKQTIKPVIAKNVPAPPPVPVNNIKVTIKTYMKKDL
ncbi:N-alpha-acetyltransferase 80 [Rhynchophorus ferrugineus]|uniref:N-alpha-acetyltransferase 80 n=1 Tax=Rhynchophorus ferrugineus TaxID=354439 RepID=UPI003FCE92EF